MKKSIILIITMIFILTSSFAVAAEQQLNGIAAVVNDDIITNSQVMQQVKVITAQLQQQRQTVPPLETIKKQTLDQMIDQQLQLQVAKRLGVKVPVTEVDQTIANIAAENHMSLAVFKQQITKQGFSYKDYHDQIEKQLILNTVQRGVLGKKVVVTDDDIKESLKTLNAGKQNETFYHLEAILVPLAATATPDQMIATDQLAANIIQAAKQGQAFSAIMASTSQPLQGGDMGFKALSQLPPALSGELTKARPNAIIGPIQASEGLYILKILEIRKNNAEHVETLNHLRHILIKPGQLETPSQLKIKLDNLRERIIKGEDFAKLAEEFSQDTNSSSKGGDIGWLSSDNVPLAFANVMNSLPIKQVSQAIQTQDGWELIQVLARKQIANNKSFLQNQAKQEAFQRKLGQEVQNWVKELRSQAYIKITS